MSFQKESASLQQEEEVKKFVPPAGKQPNVNTQKKTEDVLATKGLSFEDFNLSQELHMVS
jgi:hypothetical protein